MTKKLRPKPIRPVASKPPRWQTDRNVSLFLWISIPVVLAVVIGLVTFWAYDTNIARWREPVVRVNDTTIDMNYYVKMLRFYRIAELGPDPTLPYQVLQMLQDDELVKQGAPELGIEVTEQEITDEIKSYFQPSGEGNQTQPSTDFEKAYREWLDGSGLSESEYRGIVKTILLREKIREHFKQTEVPAEAEQVYMHLIVVANEGNATELREKILDGEDFAALSEEHSIFEDVRDRKGDMGWIPRGIYTELDEEVFDLEVGNISEPLKMSQGYCLVRISDRDESRPLEDEDRNSLAAGLFEKWILKQRESANVTEYIDQAKISWAVRQASR
ncbi:MAG: SurA N-terminal domain-containing protein [Dehalococcoidia bacterium]|nr:SurA N-terminal domain-containing protein [Dehalococcoidia bacterium]